MKQLFARTNTTALLRANKVPVIGQISELTKTIHSDGSIDYCRTVEFDLDGNGAKDIFIFINGSLAFNSISLIRDIRIYAIYKELITGSAPNINSFVKNVIEAFLFIEMGFAD